MVATQQQPQQQQPRRQRRPRPQPPKHAVNRAKVVVVGDSGVGKSWWVSCVAQRAYTTDGTVGVDFVAPASPLRHREREWRLNFWDMGGLGVYSQIRNELYKPNTSTEPSCIVFMFSFASRVSFRRLDQWYAEVQQGGGIINDCSAILLGNQCDVSFAEREVSAHEAQLWASAHRMQFCEVSALCGTGVNAATAAMLDLISGHQQQSTTPAPSLVKPTNNATPSSTPRTQQPQEHATTTTAAGNHQNNQNSSNTCSRPSSSSKHRVVLEMEGVDLASWGVKALKSRLELFQVSHAGCLTKPDLVAKLREVADALLPGARKVAAREQEAMAEEIRERVVREVQEWGAGKDIRVMLNSIHGSEQLERNADIGPVNKCYKRALLLIHPDKHNPNDIEAYTRATETFKAVNTAFSRFQATNKKRASFS